MREGEREAQTTWRGLPFLCQMNVKRVGEKRVGGRWVCTVCDIMSLVELDVWAWLTPGSVFCS